MTPVVRMTDTLFHASPHCYEWPEYDALVANSTGFDNSVLGLWCAVRRDWIEGFGNHTYQVTYSGNTLILPVDVFTRRCFDPAVKTYPTAHDYFKAMRADWLAQGVDAVAIREASGQVEMLVILNLAAIQYFKLHARA